MSATPGAVNRDLSKRTWVLGTAGPPVTVFQVVEREAMVEGQAYQILGLPHVLASADDLEVAKEQGREPSEGSMVFWVPDGDDGVTRMVPFVPGPHHRFAVERQPSGFEVGQLWAYDIARTNLDNACREDVALIVEEREGWLAFEFRTTKLMGTAEIACAPAAPLADFTYDDADTAEAKVRDIVMAALGAIHTAENQRQRVMERAGEGGTWVSESDGSLRYTPPDV